MLESLAARISQAGIEVKQQMDGYLQWLRSAKSKLQLNKRIQRFAN
jgi:hypothetical protein